ncbi:terpenoid synthase [Pterulicium gracile]|uniref:(2E,6E)-farnesyl diphosphate synthase n=1 Tax=Pterulicium gracile TaxID=1884261 RepID=A0A5C3QH58_9AGAR|nr:terpenoid synthase [Pterula gracilis]
MSKYFDLLASFSSSPWTDENESAILEPYTYLTANPGKEFRGAMIAAFNTWLNVPKHKLDIIARVVSMLHNASLLVDDIQDDSQLRRGQPVAHKIYGVPQTINTGNYVYFLAYRELCKLREITAATDAASSSASQSRVMSETELDTIVTDELVNLHRGQGLELIWRDSLRCPSEDEYIAMVNNKTGGLLRLAVKLMMACSTTNIDVDYVPLVNLIGVFFQIRDDYMNLQSEQYSMNKGFAEDLTEGKFSFPIVHGINKDTSNRQLLNVLQKRPQTPTLKIHAVSYLRDRTGSFEYTENTLRDLEAEIRECLRGLGGNRGLDKILDTLVVKSPGDDKSDTPGS